MKDFIKLSIVLAAYVVAFVVAAGVVHLRELRPQWQATAQASPGMAAFADFILFVEVFGVAAAAPTALAGYFLRPFRRICTVFATGCLALAVTGLLAAVIVVWTRSLHAETGLLRALALAGEHTNVPIAHTGPKLPGLCAVGANVALPLDIAGGSGNGRCGICLRACLAAMKSPLPFQRMAESQPGRQTRGRRLCAGGRVCWAVAVAVVKGSGSRIATRFS